MSINGMIDRFIKSVSIRARRTGVSYRTGLDHFLSYLKENNSIGADDPIETLTLAHARDFASWLAYDYKTPLGKRLKITSLSLYLTALLQFYDFLIIEDIIKHTNNYVKFRKWIRDHIRIPEEPIDKKLPPDHVVEGVLRAANQQPETEDDLLPSIQQRRRLVWLRDRAIVYCLYSSGCRVGELVGLSLDDLQLDDRGAWVTGKGTKVRFIRFSSEAWQYLIAYLEERGSLPNQTPLFLRHDRGAAGRIAPLSTLSVERLITRLAKEADVYDAFKITPHSFRHYFATKLLKSSKNLALTQDALGHSTPAMTRVYAKTTKEDLIEAHDDLFE